MGFQLFTTVSFLQKHNIIHCDLKPENIIQLALYAYIYETTNSLKEHKLPREITDKIAILNKISE